MCRGDLGGGGGGETTNLTGNTLDGITSKLLEFSVFSNGGDERSNSVILEVTTHCVFFVYFWRKI